MRARTRLSLLTHAGRQGCLRSQREPDIQSSTALSALPQLRRRLARRVSRSASCVSRVCVLTVEVEEKFEPFEVTFEAAQDKLNRGILHPYREGSMIKYALVKA